MTAFSNPLRWTGRCLYLPVLILHLVSGICRAELPEGFVYLEEISPEIIQDIRYHTGRNFVGKPVDGYDQPRAILTRPAATALADVQKALTPFGFGLKVFDAYRPQQAVNHFVRWARDLKDTKTREEYYPNVPKEKLFEELYIASRSGHSRGSTVDVTLVILTDEGDPEELDMGSGFDFFDPASWPDSVEVTPQQRANRLLLREIMISHGFKPYEQEWWHFTLKDEPWPDTYFDFPVR